MLIFRATTGYGTNRSRSPRKKTAKAARKQGRRARPRVAKEAHAVFLDGVRGHNKSPGEYRRIPNWVGPPGCKIEEARYVPIGAEALPEAMGRWEKYIHEDAPDRLVQLGILHAEFESLHPFLDGNGRLGRMLIPLFMAKHGLLRAPMFHISPFSSGTGRNTTKGCWPFPARATGPAGSRSS